MSPSRRAHQALRVGIFRWLLALALTLSLVPVAKAEPTEADRVSARALALEGYDALQRKDFATAEDRFRRADKLVHAPTLLVDHARALIGLKRLVEAYERYALVLREGVADNAPWPWKRALKDATSEIEALKPRLSWLTVAVVGPARPGVFIDGRRVPQAAIGVPRAVNPGHHVVAARAGNYASKEREVTLAEGQQLEIELLLERLPPGAPEQAELVEAEAPPEDAGLAPAPPPRSNWRRTAGAVALSAGGVGLVVGAVTGVLALRIVHDQSWCESGGHCVVRNDDQEAQGNDRGRYTLLRHASTIGFAVGGVAAVGGLTLLFWPSHSAQPKPSGATGEKRSTSDRGNAAGLRVTPFFTPEMVGLQGSF